MSIKGECIKSYLERFPNTQSQTLAKKIYNENVELFGNVERVRDLIRYYRGSIGNKSRRQVATTEYLKEPDYSTWNKIPEGEKELNWNNPFIIDATAALVISDVHVPYHDKTALITALEYGQKKGVDCLYINGDFFDYYQLSRFIKDPRNRSFAEELKTGKEILQLIADNFPDSKKYFKIGNHDYRYELYMTLKAPELLDIEDFSFDRIIGLERMGYTLVKNKEFAIINGLATLHGHEGGHSFSNPVNPARGAFLKMNDSVMIGHHHQPSTHTSTRALKNKYVTCWSTGCLCDLHPAYMPVNNWAHGFAVNEKDGDGYNIANKRIINGKIQNV